MNRLWRMTRCSLSDDQRATRLKPPAYQPAKRLISQLDSRLQSWKQVARRSSGSPARAAYPIVVAWIGSSAAPSVAAVPSSVETEMRGVVPTWSPIRIVP